MTNQENPTYNEDIDPVKTYERKVQPDKEFYDRVIATKANGSRTLAYEDLLEAHTGNAFLVKAGQVIRMEQRPSLHNGRTQIIDVLFVTPDLEQISDHLNTSAFEGLNQKLLSGVWTQSTHIQKIATCVADEFPYELLENENVSHMFFAAHCNAEWLIMLYGHEGNVNSCHENFLHGFLRLPAIQAIEDEAERRAKVQQLSDRNDINMFQGNQFIRHGCHWLLTGRFLLWWCGRWCVASRQCPGIVGRSGSVNRPVGRCGAEAVSLRAAGAV